MHGKLPNAPSWRPTRPSCESLRGLPAHVKAVLEQHARAAAHPMDVMRTGVSALGCVLPEKDDHNVPGAQRHRRPADGLARLDAAVLVPLRTTAAASRSRPTTIRSAATSCTCCTARPPQRAVGARDAHLADPVRRARVQCLDVHRARDRRHRLGHLLGDHRRHRRAARARSTAAPTKSPSRSRSATTRRTRPRPTSAAASSARK